MRRNVPKKSSSDVSMALTAVALQDHWMKQLNLSNPIGPRNIPVKKKNWKKDAKSVVDTGLGARPIKKAVSANVEKEYVLDPKPPPLSLAQRLGLIERPAELLTETEWQDVKQQSKEREDSSAPCVICKEDFGTEQQILLSCSHVFHRNCLEAFERFSGKKTCPMCRKEQYQKRVIHEGAKAYRSKCATRIQAAWRGYVVRCWYLKLQETNPPKDPKLRKKFFEDKLHSITDRLVKSLDVDIGAFLSQIDQSVEASRDVFRHFDNLHRVLSEDEWEDIQLQAVQRGNTECPICLTALEGQGYKREGPRRYTDDAEPPAVPSLPSVPINPRPSTTTAAGPSSSSSGSAKKKTHEKIKLLPRHPLPEIKKEKPTQKPAEKPVIEENRCRVLLSCSHVFHQTCLEAFEEFAEGDRKFVCPVCRARYQKKVL